mmetsp:Transcript_228/g.565  ORF Transcript_228/g.565 Transcript_228/m.565 type:complete len:81 (+) Transcript_228:81-323(+)
MLVSFLKETCLRTEFIHISPNTTIDDWLSASRQANHPLANSEGRYDMYVAQPLLHLRNFCGPVIASFRVRIHQEVKFILW